MESTEGLKGTRTRGFEDARNQEVERKIYRLEDSRTRTQGLEDSRTRGVGHSRLGCVSVDLAYRAQRSCTGKRSSPCSVPGVPWQFLASPWRWQVVLVRYEDLVTQPGVELNRIGSALGIKPAAAVRRAIAGRRLALRKGESTSDRKTGSCGHSRGDHEDQNIISQRECSLFS